MDFTRQARTENFYVNIKRPTIEQLDQAIEDLEKRGFELVQRGIIAGEVPAYEVTNRKKYEYQYAGSNKYDKAWAKLVRKN